MPLHLQSKLLTALERREVVPVGADKPEPIDVRLVCATNLSRERLADENLFRQDLLYRINTVEILLPPLRERREDIPLLLEHFIALYAQKYNFPRQAAVGGAIDELTAHDWPGNVRALRHAVERAVILSEGCRVRDRGLFAAHTAGALCCAAFSGHFQTRCSWKKAPSSSALEKYQGNISRAAEALGLTRASLYRRKEKYGL